MPDIFKNKFLPESDDTVMIPDQELLFDRDFHEDWEEDPEGEDQAQDAQEAGPAPALPPAELAQEELHLLREAAYQQAHKEAVKKYRGEISECIDNVGRTLDEFSQAHERFMDEYAQNLVHLAIDIAQKIMLIKIQEDDRSLMNLVMQAVGGVKNVEWFSVELSNQLTGLVAYLQDEFLKPENGGRVEVVTGSHPIDTMRINTPDGVIDASVSEQIANLKKSLRKERENGF